MTALHRRSPLGALMLAARRTHGWSLRDFAAAVPLSPAHASDVECGRRVPSEDLLVRMMTALRVPATERDHWYAAAGVLPAALLDAMLARPGEWERVREVLR